jgi:hypothetical protein
LVVVASTASEVVRFAGGWLFDRVTAGWDVVAMVSDSRNRRPLTILGADVVDLSSALASHVRIPLPQALAVDHQLYSTDPRVREGVLEVFEHVLIDEVAIWGRRCPPELASRLVPVRHPLSRAARAFKRSALSAAGAESDTPEAAETFYRRVAATPRRDLIPVASQD